MNVAIYLRKSRAEEVSNSNFESLENHKETLIKFANTNNLNVIEIFQEIISGENLYLRPKMLELLDNICKKKYSAVLCIDIDRLGRGAMSEQGIILETFKSNNTKIITPRKVYDLNNEIDEEYTEFETFIARRELKLIKRRLQRGIKKTLLDGGFIPIAPYGYNKAIINQKPSLTINKDQAFFVKLIFDLYTQHNMGCKKIADHLNSIGVLSSSNNSFSRTSIRHIIKNQVYIGNIVWNQKSCNKKTINGITKIIYNYNKSKDWNISTGIHEPIIGLDQFNLAQTILSSRAHHSIPSKKQLKNPLASIIKCYNCHSYMQRRPYPNNSPLSHLICPNINCIPSARLDKIELAIVHSIAPILYNISPIIFPGHESKINDVNNISIASIKSTLKKLEVQKTKIYNMFEQNIYDTETFHLRLKSVSNNINVYSDMLKSFNKLNSHNNSIASYKSLLHAYTKANPENKNFILKSFINQIFYYKKKGWKPNHFELYIEYIKPPLIQSDQHLSEHES